MIWPVTALWTLRAIINGLQVRDRVTSAARARMASYNYQKREEYPQTYHLWMDHVP